MHVIRTMEVARAATSRTALVIVAMKAIPAMISQVRFKINNKFTYICLLATLIQPPFAY